MKKHTLNKIKRVMIMSGIFIAALIVYFYISLSNMEHSKEVYSNMSDPSLPVIYVNTNDYLINPMNAHVQDMGNNCVRDMITVLPENRQLKLYIQEYDNMVTSINYEIRSLDLSHLIENGKIKEINRENGNIDITVPIQNLIKKNQEYLLKISLDTGEQLLNYYTRIVWVDNDYTKEIEQIALNFTTSTFERSNSKNITQYLETNDIADNSTLAHLNLHNSYKQITWGDSGMESKGQYYMTVKEFNGVMSEVQIKYETKLTDEESTIHNFVNEDNYVFRYDPSRIYIMNYDRKTHELFEGNENSIKNKKIILGIGNKDNIDISKSEDEKYIAFISNKELFTYDQNNKEIVKVFSYRSEINDVRTINDKHDIKILNVDINGNVHFIVYGYINRGRHEGNSGVIYYTYDAGRKTIVENFFISIPKSYESIKEDIQKLAYISGAGMMYLYNDGTVYGIDTESLEVMTMVTGLNEEEIESSYSNQYIAYQNPEAEDIFHSKKITLMNLENNDSAEITKESSYVKIFGFNQDDLVYGEIEPEYAEKYTIDNDIPTSVIHIVGPDTSEKTRYNKDGLMFTNIIVNENRIQFNEVCVDDNGQYQSVGNDTIISSKQKNDLESKGVTTFSDTLLGKVWYIEINDIGNKHVRSYAPKSFSIEKASSIELANENEIDKTAKFKAYSLGHYIGNSRTLVEAYRMVYEDYGYVTDEKGTIVWNRADKKTAIKIRNALDKMSNVLPFVNELNIINENDDYIMLNATGMDMNSVLYYLNKGYPVIVFINGRTNLITAYDQFNITVLDVETNIENLIGREDAENEFKNNNNHFIAVIPKNPI